MVNYVEGVLGGGASLLDLRNQSDRQYLLDSLVTATRRGVFTGCK
jgi:hypothetical protein